MFNGSILSSIFADTAFLLDGVEKSLHILVSKKTFVHIIVQSVQKIFVQISSFYRHETQIINLFLCIDIQNVTHKLLE